MPLLARATPRTALVPRRALVLVKPRPEPDTAAVLKAVLKQAEAGGKVNGKRQWKRLAVWCGIAQRYLGGEPKSLDASGNCTHPALRHSGPEAPDSCAPRIKRHRLPERPAAALHHPIPRATPPCSLSAPGRDTSAPSIIASLPSP